MEGIALWITPTLLVALFAWLRFDLREQRRDVREEIRELTERFDGRIDELAKRFDGRIGELTKQVNERFDQAHRELGDLRERMAKLEGALEAFVAGRRDRDAA